MVPFAEAVDFPGGSEVLHLGERIRIRIRIRIEFIAKYVCTYKEFALVLLVLNNEQETKKQNKTTINED